MAPLPPVFLMYDRYFECNLTMACACQANAAPQGARRLAQAQKIRCVECKT